MTDSENDNDPPELVGQTIDSGGDADDSEGGDRTENTGKSASHEPESSTPDESASEGDDPELDESTQTDPETRPDESTVSDAKRTPEESTVKPGSTDVSEGSGDDDLNELLICSGESGGKSTLIGGMLQYLYQKEDVIVTYDVEFGEVSEFEEQLVRPMIDDGTYPPNTESPYATRFNLSFDSRRREDAAITFVDFPGSWLDEKIDLPPSDPEGVRSAHGGGSDVRFRTEQGNDPADEDIRSFLRYHYTEADRVILLLNLERVMNDDIDVPFAYDLGLIQEIAADVECAIVVTGVDVIGYDPSEEGLDANGALQMVKSGLGIGREESVDEELLETMIRDIPQGPNPQLHNIMRGVKSGCGADFFGVAVPSDADGGLIENGDGFETRGFDRILDWIL